MSTHDPHRPHDAEAAALEEEITRGTLHDAPTGTGSTAAGSPGGDGTSIGPSTGTAAPAGIRTGTLAWGVIALLVALWSLATTVLDWDIDPALVAITLAALGGLALVAGGIAGATRKGH
ncbi:hypothetical protein E7744_03845 [Citricoccus sp. SGAir0253]|uniref:hypothetical protein n=1 Tax=Citricoccus sp. SGAir0253 TaxID=2567881 RepID=UPI0010CCED4A|nr:hypothetical protein [Citricoccus sp. SGAir0253]QCU77442.1 hypothetical protein E7744_03845 [Citricoccus sp. SGAir0253]